MSSQSGISALEELLAAFHGMDGGIVIGILDDFQLQPAAQFAAASLADAFSTLHTHFGEKYPEPGYAIVRDDTRHVFVSFIPDEAPIKRKMLYASSKNTLLQQLGSGHFGKGNVLALTELDELSEAHYRHTQRDAKPKTEDERTLELLDSMQSLAASKRELPLMHGSKVLFAVHPEAQQALDSHAAGSLLVFRIDNEEVVLEEKRQVALDELQRVTAAGPRYYVYGHDKTYFIYSCPSGSKVRERMLYAANKAAFIAHLAKVDETLEVGDMEELDLGLEAPPAPTGMKFSKPRGPRRR